MSCGMYMEECQYKVYDERDFVPEAAEYVNNFKLASYDTNHLMELREISDCCTRCCLLSGMKPHLTGMIPNKFSQIESYIHKNCSFSTFCGAKSVTTMTAVVHSDPKFDIK